MQLTPTILAATLVLSTTAANAAEPAAAGTGTIVFHMTGFGELDTRIFIPTEPGCFSNNAKPRFGPPSFKRSRFNHDRARTVQQCALGSTR